MKTYVKTNMHCVGAFRELVQPLVHASLVSVTNDSGGLSQASDSGLLLAEEIASGRSGSLLPRVLSQSKSRSVLALEAVLEYCRVCLECVADAKVCGWLLLLYIAVVFFDFCFHFYLAHVNVSFFFLVCAID